MKKKNIYKTPVVAMVTAFANLVILNVLFILTSLPIFTIGVSYSSMFSTTKEMDTSDIYVFKTYFSHFKEQFKQSTKCWLIVLGVLVIIYFEFILLLQINDQVPIFVYVCLIIPFLFILAYIPWLLIQSSYFYCGTFAQLKNAFILLLRFVPQSVFIMILMSMPFVLFAYQPMFFAFAWPVWIFVYFSASTSWIYKAVKTPMNYILEQYKNEKK